MFEYHVQTPGEEVLLDNILPPAMTTSVFTTPISPLPNDVSSGSLPVTGAGISQISTGSTVVEISIVTKEDSSASQSNGIQGVAFPQTTTIQRNYRLRLNIPLSSPSTRMELLNVSVCQNVNPPAPVTSVLPNSVASSPSASASASASASVSNVAGTAGYPMTPPVFRAEASPSPKSQAQQLEHYKQLQLQQLHQRQRLLFQKLQILNSIQEQQLYHHHHHHHQQQQQQQQQQIMQNPQPIQAPETVSSFQLVGDTAADVAAESVSRESSPEIVWSSLSALPAHNPGTNGARRDNKRNAVTGDAGCRERRNIRQKTNKK